jgi:hypothetical protein
VLVAILAIWQLLAIGVSGSDALAPKAQMLEQKTVEAQLLMQQTAASHTTLSFSRGYAEQLAKTAGETATEISQTTWERRVETRAKATSQAGLRLSQIMSAFLAAGASPQAAQAADRQLADLRKAAARLEAGS